MLSREKAAAASITSARDPLLHEGQLAESVIVVRARVIDTDMHAYMPEPESDEDHQIIDLYPAFEMSTKTNTPMTKPNTNDVIRVEFYDRNNSSLRNANGQILSVETETEASNYNKPAAGGSRPKGKGGGYYGAGQDPAALAKAKKILQDEIIDTSGVTEKTEGGKHYDKPRWPIVTPHWDISDYQGSPRAHGSHAGIDIRTLNAAKEPVNGKMVVAMGGCLVGICT